MVAQKVITDIGQSEGKPRSRGVAALPEFHYKNGYTLCLADLGKVGVKIELTDANEASAAVILPPDKTQECSKWLSRTIGQQSRSLPEELSKILGRLLTWREPSSGSEKEPNKILERGDKKTIKDALRLLATHR
jgi:hypothetical protein